MLEMWIWEIEAPHTANPIDKDDILIAKHVYGTKRVVSLHPELLVRNFRFN